MKLKLFIIMLIAISFAMMGVLSGCGGNSGGNADEPRDETIKIDCDELATAFEAYLNGKQAIVYNDINPRQILVSSKTTLADFDIIYIYTISNTTFNFKLICLDVVTS